MNTSQKEALWLHAMAVGARLGCHQMPQRSFTYKGYQFPICARCTGILVALPFAYLIYFSRKKISMWLCLLGIIIMVADGFFQYVGRWESTNVHRFLTGLCGGFGFTVARLKFFQMFFVFIRAFHSKEKESTHKRYDQKTL